MIHDKRNIRIELMNALYQYDMMHSLTIDFKPIFEQDESQAIFDNITGHLNDIDQTIEDHLFDYSLARLAYVDRAIIRLAVYELKYTDLAKQIIINEAVEITKIYSNLDDAKQHKFTNRVLDNIAKTIKG